MKIIRYGEPTVIMSNEDGRHKYFAWPTVTRLKNGRIAAVASGYRLSHICPFGKTVISFSEDEGKTYTRPAPVIDTPLDDRDGGILAFGESGVIVTSFNNTANMQRSHLNNRYNLAGEGEEAQKKLMTEYRSAYLDYITPEDEEKYLGSTFRVSFNNGTSFGPLYRCPVTSPHGPLERENGDIIWVGRTFSHDDSFRHTDKVCDYKHYRQVQRLKTEACTHKEIRSVKAYCRGKCARPMHTEAGSAYLNHFFIRHIIAEWRIIPVLLYRGE
jgi:hypothetical protein